MRQVFQKSYLSKELCVADVPAPVLKGEGVIVRNAASLISPGTERATVSFARKGMIEKIQAQPERVKLLLRKMKQSGVVETLELARRKLETPIALGYSSAGVVDDLSAGLAGFKRGDRVACAGAKYANHAEAIYVPKNLCVKLPDNLSFEEGAFVAPGAIALHGVRLGNIGLNETVVIIGLGLIGQLAMQLVKAQGGIPVGIDLSERRLQLAKELGCPHVFHRNAPDLQSAVLSLTQNRGADIALVTAATQSSDPVVLAAELARDRATVVVVGDVGMNVPRTLFYNKELSLVVSRSYGPGRYDEKYEEQGQDYPAGYVRWSQRDNMAAFLQLASEEKINLKPLIDERLDVANAAAAYDRLTDPAITDQPLGIVLLYPYQANGKSHATRLEMSSLPSQAIAGKVSLGVIGAGNFLRTVFLPQWQKHADVTFSGVAATTGLSARTTAEQYKFSFCTTDTKELLADKNTQAVLIGTRHDSHAQLLCDALAAGKHVFVEKPLATTPEELDACVKAAGMHAAQRVMVGFNRRFSPLTTQINAMLDKSAGSRPLAITYRVNAGSVPEEHWVHQFGGRVVGEVCHFVDWCLAVAKDIPVEVFARRVGDGANHDVIMTLTFKNGSTAQIQYLMRTNAAMGKEYIEVLSPALHAVVDDFKSLRWQQGGQIRQKTFAAQEKGFQQEIHAFVQCLKTGGLAPIVFEEIVATTQTTFAILESLRTGEAVKIGS